MCRAGSDFASDICERHDFRTGPSVLGPVSCWLCGKDVDSEATLLQHLELHGKAGVHSPQRLLEEYRKRVLYFEEREGPFPVSGPEIRRAASNHAWQSSHSFCTSGMQLGKATYIDKACNGEERGLLSCSICALSHWKEDLLLIGLFTKPADLEGVPDIRPGHQERFWVRKDMVRKVDEFLNADAYGQRWPKIPKHELLGTSVKHPFLEDSRWLLDTKGMSEILTGDNCVKLDAEGKAPKVKACWACALDLCSNHPQMPRMALANDNLMLREPSVFHDLSDATLLLLALARAVVVKEVAEPLRQVPQAEQQQVLKGNTIALPQADCRVLATKKLPAEHGILCPFLRDHLAVVFCGKDVRELGRFPKLEVNWHQYVRAVHFLKAHNPEYEQVDLDEEAAKLMFQDCGIPDVIKELITAIDVDEGFAQPHGAAAETGPEENLEEGEQEEGEEVAPVAYTVDGAKQDKMDPVELLQALACKVDLLLQKLTAANEDGGDDNTAPASGQEAFIELQKLAQDMGEDAFHRRLQKHMETTFGSKQPAVIVPAGGEPLKMWQSSFWVKQFPELFCYGDGAYGLNRRRELTFYCWARMMLMRTELDYAPMDGQEQHDAMGACSARSAWNQMPDHPERFNPDGLRIQFSDLLCMTVGAGQRL